MARVARFFLYIIPLCVLLVLGSTYFPFIGGKYYLFRLFVSLAAGLAVLGWAFFDDPASLRVFFSRSLKTPLGIAVTAFAAVFLLASIFADDAHAAFWSNFERAEGAFQMLHYWGFFVLIAGLFTARKHWRLIFGVSLVAAVGMTLYGMLSALSPSTIIGAYGAVADKSLWQRLISPDARFQGSLGNAAYVAPYLMFAAFYAVWLWFEGNKTWLRTTLYGLLVAWFAFIFLLSQTRGAFLGLVAAVFAALLYMAFSRREFRKQAALIVIALAVVLGGLFAFRGTPLVRALPGSRFLTISLGERTVQTRIWNWEAAWQGFNERPLFGWGPENYPTVFDKHFDTRHFIPGQNTETWFDRAHSVIFDQLAETGIVGLLAYLSIFVAFFWQFFRWVRARQGKETPFQQALLLAMPVAYFVQGLALFDVLPIFMNLLIFLGFSLHIFSNAHEE